jgi:hypothetical protein
MSDSSSDTNAITPDWADCSTNSDSDSDSYCDITEVNTHWTPEWNQTLNDASTNALKGEGDELLH